MLKKDNEITICELKEKNVIIYGWGKTGQQVAFVLDKIGCDNYRVTDSNSDLWGLQETGITVESNIEIIDYVLKNKSEMLIIVSIDDEKKLVESMRTCGMNAYSWKSMIDIWVECCLTEKINYNVQYHSYLLQWFLHLSEELTFWEKAYASPEGYKHDLYLKNANQTYWHEKYLKKLLVGNEKILDVGSGIISRYGNMLPDGKLVNLIPVDPLAYWYNKFNKKYLSQELLCENEHIEFGIFEGLSDSFDLNSVDVIIISNALDHCIDPFRSIIECLKILKKDGVLLLKHLRREAINEKWGGLHQWNIDVTYKGELLIWNNENYVNISRLLEKCARIEVNIFDEDERGLKGKFGFCVAEITKTGELDESIQELLEVQNVRDNVKTLEKLFKEIVEKDYTNKEIWKEKSCFL